MKYATRRINKILSALALALLLNLTASAQIQKKHHPDAKKMTDANNQARKAAKVFNEIMSARDKAIPQDLLDRAEAVAVFPGVLKAGFIVGGRGGHKGARRILKEGSNSK